VKQADIDKWVELGTLRERQRIIKLLEDKLGFDDEIGIMDSSLNQVSPDGLIALIKGEQR
jgi:hypothetical protein